MVDFGTVLRNFILVTQKTYLKKLEIVTIWKPKLKLYLQQIIKPRKKTL